MTRDARDLNPNKSAVLANMALYDATMTRAYIDGAPHIKHVALRELYAALLTQVYEYARQYSSQPRVLDLGAGEGSVTLPFLELGAVVTAVDVSESQLAGLQDKCQQYSDRLELRCEDVEVMLKSTEERYDIVVANSFLHHIPDYLGLVGQALRLLNPHGQFFSFQDPLRYDTMGWAARVFSEAAYFSWRISRGDVLGGLRRRFRRGRGEYLADSLHDNAEYHVTRNGVDQDAIAKMFWEAGFECDIQRYFSTQSSIFQPVGAAMGVKNTFAIVARDARGK